MCFTHLIFSLQEGHFTHDSDLGLLKPILGSTPGCLHELLNLVKQVREADLFKQSSEVFGDLTSGSALEKSGAQRAHHESDPLQLPVSQRTASRVCEHIMGAGAPQQRVPAA